MLFSTGQPRCWALLLLLSLTPRCLAVRDLGVVPDNQIGDDKPWFCHELDCPPYKVTGTHGDVEVRSYQEGWWASTTITGSSYDRAIYVGFMRLFQYISGENELDKKIAMTTPVRTLITPGEGPFCEDHFTVSFFVPFQYQDAPPKPTDEDVFLEESQAQTLYVLSYSGFSSEKKIIGHATELLDQLDQLGLAYDKSYYYAAGYDSPFRLINRHNEIWIAAPGKVEASA